MDLRAREGGSEAATSSGDGASEALLKALWAGLLLFNDEAKKLPYGTLVQVWLPQRKLDSSLALSTKGLPFCISGVGDVLALFRCISCRYGFGTDITCPELLGGPGRVFTTGVPEIAREMQQEHEGEQVHSVLVLPMSAAPGRSSIVGVLEVVQTVKVMDVRFLVNMLAPILARVNLYTCNPEAMPLEAPTRLQAAMHSLSKMGLGGSPRSHLAISLASGNAPVDPAGAARLAASAAIDGKAAPVSREKDEAPGDAPQYAALAKPRLSRLSPHQVDGVGAGAGVASGDGVRSDVAVKPEMVRPVPSGSLGKSLVVERRSMRRQTSLGPARSTLSRESGSLISSAFQTETDSDEEISSYYGPYEFAPDKNKYARGNSGSLSTMPSVSSPQLPQRLVQLRAGGAQQQQMRWQEQAQASQPGLQQQQQVLYPQHQQQQQPPPLQQQQQQLPQSQGWEGSQQQPARVAEGAWAQQAQQAPRPAHTSGNAGAGAGAVGGAPGDGDGFRGIFEEGGDELLGPNSLFNGDSWDDLNSVAFSGEDMLGDHAMLMELGQEGQEGPSDSAAATASGAGGQAPQRTQRRRGKGSAGKPGKKLKLEEMEAHFGLGLKDAADRLGICATTLKRACRRVGIQRWPRRLVPTAADTAGGAGDGRWQAVGQAMHPAPPEPSSLLRQAQLQAQQQSHHHPRQQPLQHPHHLQQQQQQQQQIQVQQPSQQNSMPHQDPRHQPQQQQQQPQQRHQRQQMHQLQQQPQQLQGQQYSPQGLMHNPSHAQIQAAPVGQTYTQQPQHQQQMQQQQQQHSMANASGTLSASSLQTQSASFAAVPARGPGMYQSGNPPPGEPPNHQGGNQTLQTATSSLLSSVLTSNASQDEGSSHGGNAFGNGNMTAAAAINLMQAAQQGMAGGQMQNNVQAGGAQSPELSGLLSLLLQHLSQELGRQQATGQVVTNSMSTGLTGFAPQLHVTSEQLQQVSAAAAQFPHLWSRVGAAARSNGNSAADPTTTPQQQQQQQQPPQQQPSAHHSNNDPLTTAMEGFMTEGHNSAATQTAPQQPSYATGHAGAGPGVDSYFADHHHQPPPQQHHGMNGGRSFDGHPHHLGGDPPHEGGRGGSLYQNYNSAPSHHGLSDDHRISAPSHQGLSDDQRDVSRCSTGGRLYEGPGSPGTEVLLAAAPGGEDPSVHGGSGVAAFLDGIDDILDGMGAPPSPGDLGDALADMTE